MGCDIHVAVERRVDGRWELAGTEGDLDLDFGRNYVLFGVLANVRNGYGVAGFDTGDPTPCIQQDRGIPDDVSEDLYRLIFSKDPEDFWIGDHSFGWVSLAELEAFDWDQPRTARGVIGTGEVLNLVKYGRPSRWSAWVSGPGVEIVDPPEIARRIIAGDTHDELYARVEWTLPIREQTSFPDKILPKLRELGDPEDVRIVFGFDS